ncbi:hypothetical protein CAOG_08459 [Capsaspora owczarzaki ATCC 30864]|uniref:G-protein coupled receptors family 3 profile domain-containing protein n=1 Tax=Capsaspora owczarzaki (strain ATCC 30864) TaxID=595528 RepID=A0A0D2WJH6_CAPO3|nr:hypothetical protein CAOG_08459 [Capsaspora owczarzaki ATCC 30864]KJE89518.1 hypothetical protein CAOG_008459 [Capsaspora owczarzaki ATCC 30864]|eukprot:XP_011270031.1 hypothetical protein CAOG_08459 [Capsaspora owczarzaki ATCC 30864]
MAPFRPSLVLAVLTLALPSLTTAYSVGCFPASERRATRTDLESIRISHANWNSSRLSALVAQIVLEEKLGFGTIREEFGDDRNAFDQVDQGTADLFLDANPEAVQDLIDLYVTQMNTVTDAGPLGVFTEYGWYLPEYVWNISNKLDSYPGFMDENVIALFHLENIPVDTHLDNTTLHSAFDMIEATMQGSQCNVALNASATATDCAAAVEATIEHLRDVAHLHYAENTIDLWTLPDSWNLLDHVLIQNLELPFNTVVPVPTNLDQAATEHALADLIEEHYLARKPFLTYFWQPHFLFAPDSPVKLHRVQLPHFNADHCNVSSSDYRCEYQSHILRKMVATSLKARNEVAYDFVKVLHIDEIEMEEMLASVEYSNMTVDQAACSWLLAHYSTMEPHMPDPSRLVTPTEVNGSLRIAFVILAALLIAFFCVLAAGTFHYRRVRVVLSASPVFLMLMLLGAAWSMFWVILLYDDAPTDAICIARIWARHLGFSLVFGALALKTYRIAAIFNVKATKKSHQLTNVRLLVRFGEINLYVCAFLLTWTVAGAPTATTLVSHNNSYAVCSITWWDNAMYLQELAAMLGLAFLSYRVRKAPSAFNECKHMALAVYNWIIIGVILQLILNSTTGTADFYFAIQSLEVLVPVPIAILLLFVPKFYLTLRGKGSEVTTSSFRGSNPNGSHPKTPSDPSNSNAKAASGDMEMSSGNGVDSETGRPELSGKAAAAEYKNIRRENIRLMREIEGMRTQLLRLHNPHSGTVEVL